MEAFRLLENLPLEIHSSAGEKMSNVDLIQELKRHGEGALICGLAVGFPWQPSLLILIRTIDCGHNRASNKFVRSKTLMRWQNFFSLRARMKA